MDLNGFRASELYRQKLTLHHFAYLHVWPVWLIWTFNASRCSRCLAYLYILRIFQDVPRLQLSSSCPRAQLLGARWAADASLLLPRVAEAEFQQAAAAASRTA